jgi:hypothetical protein
VLDFSSRDVGYTAVFSALLGVINTVIYSMVYPTLPPIVIASVVNCFFLAVTICFCRKQWIIGVLAFIVTALVRGLVLPGQLMIPAYGLLFQAAKGRKRWTCALAGFAGSGLHLLYGVLFAPLIFSVAPATAVISLVKPYAGGIASAIAICTALFGIGGAVAAHIGYRIGMRIHGNMDHVASTTSALTS